MGSAGPRLRRLARRQVSSLFLCLVMEHSKGSLHRVIESKRKAKEAVDAAVRPQGPVRRGCCGLSVTRSESVCSRDICGCAGCVCAHVTGRLPHKVLPGMQLLPVWPQGSSTFDSIRGQTPSRH